MVVPGPTGMPCTDTLCMGISFLFDNCLALSTWSSSAVKYFFQDHVSFFWMCSSLQSPPLCNNISFAIGCFLTTVPGPSGLTSSWWGIVMTTAPGQLECGASVCSTTSLSSEWSSSADEVCENTSQDDWYVRTSTDKFHSCPHRIHMPFCMCPQWEAFWILITVPGLYYWLCSADKMHMFDHQYYLYWFTITL